MLTVKQIHKHYYEKVKFNCNDGPGGIIIPGL